MPTPMPNTNIGRSPAARLADSTAPRPRRRRREASTLSRFADTARRIDRQPANEPRRGNRSQPDTGHHDGGVGPLVVRTMQLPDEDEGRGAQEGVHGCRGAAAADRETDEGGDTRRRPGCGRERYPGTASADRLGRRPGEQQVDDPRAAPAEEDRPPARSSRRARRRRPGAKPGPSAIIRFITASRRPASWGRARSRDGPAITNPHCRRAPAADGRRSNCGRPTRKRRQAGSSVEHQAHHQDRPASKRSDNGP